MVEVVLEPHGRQKIEFVGNLLKDRLLARIVQASSDGSQGRVHIESVIVELVLQNQERLVCGFK